MAGEVLEGEPSGRRDYTAEEVRAARSVLIELTHLLSDYSAGIVVVGGWVPYFTIPQGSSPHEGTKDVDVALSPALIGKEGYKSMGEILLSALYQQDPKKPFRYYRSVPMEERRVSVIVDFLTGENEGQGENGRLQEVQDLMASTMHGCDVAFVDPIPMELTGEHPGGGRDTVTVKVASLPSFLVMKGLALHNRGGEDGRKDAYDIYYCLKNVPGGLETLADRFAPYLSHPVVQESLLKIAAKFKTLEHIGPRFVADRGDDEEEREFLRRDAFEQVSDLLKLLGVTSPS